MHNYGEVMDRPIVEILEEWDTAMSLRQLRCEPMGIRVSGLGILVDSVQSTRRREGKLPTEVRQWSSRQYRMVNTRLPVSQYWTGPLMAQWIKDNNVVGLLLGQGEDGDLSGVVSTRATLEED